MGVIVDEVASALLTNDRVTLCTADGKHTCILQDATDVELWSDGLKEDEGITDFVLEGIDGTEIWSGSI